MNKIWLLFILLIITTLNIKAVNILVDNTDQQEVIVAVEEELNVKKLILGHLADSYEWNIWSQGSNHISLSLPIIIYSKNSGWHLFLSSKFNHGNSSYNGFYIATDGKYNGKIVEVDELGNEVRPFDLSLTKNAASLIINSLILILLILGIAKVMKRDPLKSHKGFTG